jgi:hypothetical protein
MPIDTCVSIWKCIQTVQMACGKGYILIKARLRKCDSEVKLTGYSGSVIVSSAALPLGDLTTAL